MTLTLHPAIAAYLQATNGFDIDALIRCFHPDAVVVDEGRTYQGTAEIRSWIEGTRDYNVALEATRVEEAGAEAVLTCRVTGTFPGSPIELRFFFTLEGDRIATLTIRE